jgi:sporulation integral membrane protein YlbJ
MKKFVSVMIMIFLFFIGFEILTESESILTSVNFSLNIFKNNIFPSLFPFFVLSDILIKCGIPEFMGNLFKNLMNKMFKISGITAFIFFMSIISGNPTNAKYTRELYLEGKINKYEATKILCFTCFSNPLFILGTVSILFLNNKDVGVLILLCHYLGNLIIGFCMRNYHPSKKENNKTSLKEAIEMMHNKRISNNKSFGSIITNSIISSVNTLLLILGVITVSLVLTTILDLNINLNSTFQSVLNGFVEMTQGLKYISLEAIPLKLKCVLTVMILSFGGLSVHMQVMSILSDTDIKYLPFLCARICHSVISSLLMYFAFDWWMSL